MPGRLFSWISVAELISIKDDCDTVSVGGTGADAAKVGVNKTRASKHMVSRARQVRMGISFSDFRVGVQCHIMCAMRKRGTNRQQDSVFRSINQKNTPQQDGACGVKVRRLYVKKL